MNKFKAGEKIVFYSNGNRFIRKVVRTINNEQLEVGDDFVDGASWRVHVKQCRRLVKKKHESYWVEANDYTYMRRTGNAVSLYCVQRSTNDIELRPVRKKK